MWAGHIQVGWRGEEDEGGQAMCRWAGGGRRRKGQVASSLVGQRENDERGQHAQIRVARCRCVGQAGVCVCRGETKTLPHVRVVINVS